MTVDIRGFRDSDYDAAVALWRGAPGIVLRDVDARGPLLAYVARNPGLSFVALDGDLLVGAVLCGTDGRRGYLQHLAVAPSHQRRGLGRQLVARCLKGLTTQGIEKCHIMVLTENHEAAAFWARIGWLDRADIKLMSHTASGPASRTSDRR